MTTLGEVDYYGSAGTRYPEEDNPKGQTRETVPRRNRPMVSDSWTLPRLLLYYSCIYCSMERELERELKRYERRYGGPGISKPAYRGFDYHCPNCDKDVRSTNHNGIMNCPICGDSPGALVLGRGPKSDR